MDFIDLLIVVAVLGAMASILGAAVFVLVLLVGAAVDTFRAVRLRYRRWSIRRDTSFVDWAGLD